MNAPSPVVPSTSVRAGCHATRRFSLAATSFQERHQKTIAALSICSLVRCLFGTAGRSCKARRGSDTVAAGRDNGAGVIRLPVADMPAAVAFASGKVEAVDATAGTVTIAHGPVDALKWPAMTMTFKAGRCRYRRL